MSRSKRALAAVLGTTLAAGALVSPATVAQTPTDLSLWVFVAGHGDFMVKQAEAWNAANPDRPINLTYTEFEYNQMHDNLTAAFLAGQGGPDLVDIEIGKFATYVKSEDNVHLLDLTDAVASYLPDLVATRNAPYQAYGEQLGIDYHLGAYLMYYNNALLNEAGVDPNAIRTWDDWVAAGKQFEEHFPDKAWSAVASNDIFSAYGLMYMNGGHVYDADGNLVLNSPENVEALQFMSDLVHVEGVAIPAPGGGIVNNVEFNAAFANGEIASIWAPQWFMTRFPTNMEGLCGSMIVRPMPLFAEDGFTTTMGGGTGTAVTDQTAPEKQELAKEFLAFAKLTYDAQKALYTDLGFDPFRPDVYEDPDLLVTDECFSGEVPFEIIKSELGNVAPEYTGPLYPEARTILQEQILPAIVNEGASVEDGLAQAQSLTEAQG
jgi:arabinosaccharide transport system substrate-binding protein